MLIIREKLPAVRNRRIFLFPVMRYLMPGYTLSRDDAYIFGLAYQRCLAVNVLWVVGVLFGANFSGMDLFSDKDFLNIMAFAAEWRLYFVLPLVFLIAYHFLLALRFHNPRKHDLRWFIRAKWPASGLAVRVKAVLVGSIAIAASFLIFLTPAPDFFANKAQGVSSLSYLWLGFLGFYLVVQPAMAHVSLISACLVHRYSAGDDVLESTS